MTADLLVTSRAIREIDQRTDDATFATTPMADGDFDGLDLWALLTDGTWPTLAAFTNDGTPTPTDRAPRAAAVINTAGRTGVILGYGYVAAPAGREYLIGPYDPQHWQQAILPNRVTFTHGGR